MTDGRPTLPEPAPPWSRHADRAAGARPAASPSGELLRLEGLEVHFPCAAASSTSHAGAPAATCGPWTGST